MNVFQQIFEMVWITDYATFSGNKFETLERVTFSEIKKSLIELELNRNPKLKLSSLLLILAENPQLNRLSLANNNYEDLPLDLFELQGELRFLNLSGNNLFALFPHQLSHLYKLEMLGKHASLITILKK